MDNPGVEMKMQIDIDPMLKTALRMRASMEGTTLSKVSEDALRAYLEPEIKAIESTKNKVKK